MKRLLLFLIPVVLLGGIGALVSMLSGNRAAQHYADAKKIDFDLLDEARPLDLIDMNFDYPERLQALDGLPVKIVGFMVPYDSLQSMQRCMLFPSYVGCNFCTPPSLSQVLYIRQKDKKNARYDFIEPPSDVTGILRLLREESEHEGHLDGFYYVIDEAVITPHLGTEAPIPSGHGDRNMDPTQHRPGELSEVSLETLAEEVSSLRELALLRPITFELVPESRLRERVRAELQLAYPTARGQALVELFDLLGFFEEENPARNWLNLQTPLWLDQRIGWVTAGGTRIELLDTVSTADPYTRLELVKLIAEALVQQHFPEATAPIACHGDAQRALIGLHQGNSQLVAYRYSRLHSISPASSPPEELFSSSAAEPRFSDEPLFTQWFYVPKETGPFFVEARTGATKALSRIDELFATPPRTTRDLFRPKRFAAATEGGTAIESIPTDFADQLLPEPPQLVESFGLGGLIPWLMREASVDQAKTVAGQVLTDRMALWQLPKTGSLLLLETRWPDQHTARLFADSIPWHPLQQSDVSEVGMDQYRVRLLRATDQAGLEQLVKALRMDGLQPTR